MIPAIITVRTKSSRLPNKCLMPFGEGNVLEHVIRRVRHHGFIPYVATTREGGDNIIARLALKNKCDFYRGETEDKLKRWLGVCEKFDLPYFYTADADDPFFDGNMARGGYGILSRGYDCVYPIFPAPFVGHMGYLLTTGVLRRACAIGSGNTEMMWHILEKVKGLKIYKTKECFRNPYRLTLDYKEDYLMLQRVFNSCGWNATTTKILEFFRKNDGIYKTNWFRNEEWKRGQN